MAKGFTRRCAPRTISSTFKWMVIFGEELQEAFIEGPVPPPIEQVRRQLGLAENVPVLVGCP